MGNAKARRNAEGGFVVPVFTGMTLFRLDSVRDGTFANFGYLNRSDSSDSASSQIRAGGNPTGPTAVHFRDAAATA